MPAPPGNPADDLPPALADVAADQLTQLRGEARTATLRALLDRHPEHAAALAAFAEDLAATERLLEVSGEPGMPLAFGRYRIERKLGEGAFGTVYLCQQDAPIARAVAVKVLRPGAGDRDTLQRFERERQWIAKLSHPAIAQVFDAGTLPDGRPYFAMEYVRGTPLDQYLATSTPSLDARLDLFAQVCRGVDHAHQRGIVHRDLKPANILVVDEDAAARPKIIDWGIAKALERTQSQSVLRTETGRVVGTPGYMSPEQAAGHSAAVDPRTDVFALGVILYELITGTLPWPRGAAGTESDPVRPSARERPRAAIPRELDWIVLMALAREPQRRYQSAAALADDLDNCRRGAAVQAMRPSTFSWLRRAVRRHRAIARVAVAALVLCGAVAWFALDYRRDAENVFTDATAAAQSLLQRAQDPRLERAPQGDAVRRELLRDALALYDQLTKTHPDAPELRTGRGRALASLSEVQCLLGEYAGAIATAQTIASDVTPLLQEAEWRTTGLALLGDAKRLSASALLFARRNDEARADAQIAVENLEQCHAADPEVYARPLLAALQMSWRANNNSGEHHRALQAIQRSIDVLAEWQTRQPSANLHGELQTAFATKAHTLLAEDRAEDAEAALDRAERELQGVAKPRVRWVANLHRLRAEAALQRGDDAAARAQLDQSVAAMRRWLEEEPGRFLPRANLCNELWSLSLLLRRAGPAAGATLAMREAIALSDALVREFPEDQDEANALVWRLCDFARHVQTAARPDELREAQGYVRRALEVLAARGTSDPECQPVQSLHELLAELDVALDAHK